MTTFTVNATATAATTNRITINSAENMFSGLPIVFSGTAFGGITAGAIYYVGTVTPGTPTSTITITSLPGGGVVTLSTATGTMTGTVTLGGQQIISVVPPGQPLNQAFANVNLNFDQIFAAGPVLSNVQIVNNTILTTNTNGNLVLAPNGTGVVQSNVHIVPNTANIRNLGSANRRWSELYVQYVDISGNIDLAGSLEVVGDLSVGGNLSVTGNIIQIGNIITDAKTIQLANTAGTANAANGSGITVGANDNIATMLYSSTSNAWTMNIGVSAVGNVTAPYFIGNGSQLTGVSNYANANAVAYGQAGWAGNIVPAASNTYSLGNSTLWWSNVWVAGNTIYIGGVPLGMAAGNVLTVNGNAVLQNDSNTSITTTGNITANIITATESATLGSLNFFASSITMADDVWDNIFISPNGESYAYLSVPKDSVANVQNTRLHNDAGNVEIGTSGGTNTWLFDSAGDLNLPNNGDLKFNSGGIVQTPDEDLRIVVQDVEDDGYNLDLVVNNGTDDNTLLRLQNDEVRIRTNITSGPSYDWQFADTGQFFVAGDIVGNYGTNLPIWILNNVGDGIGNVELQVKDYGSDAVLSNVKVGRSNVEIGIDTGGSVWSFGTGNTLTLPNGGEIDSTNNNIELRSPNNMNFEAQGDVNIYTDDGNSQWTFGSGNTLTLPGGTAVIDSSDNNIELRSNNNINMEAVGVVNVYTDNGNRQWQFGDDGNLIVPNSIYGTNSGSPIVIDAGATGDSYVSIPSFTDGGEQLVIKNKYNSSSGIRIETETGNFVISGNSITFPDSTTQSTAYTGATYGNSNVTSLLLNLGSNIISGTGNISGGNLLVTNATMTGNLTVNTSIGSQGATDLWLLPATGTTRSYGNINPFFANTYNLGGSTTRWNNVFANVANVVTLNALGNISAGGNVTAANFIGNISVTGNIQGTTPNVTIIADSYSWTFDNTGNLQGNISFTGGNITINNAPGGSEGAEIKWALPAPANTVLDTSVIQDVYQNGMRFFESGGNSRGLYMDIGNAPAGSGTAVGYRDIPQITFSANATAAANAAGCHYYSTTAGNLALTLPDNSSVAFPTGATLTIVVNAAGNVLVNQGSGVTLYQAGGATTGNRVVGAYGLATVMKVAANTWVISGTGVY